MEDVVEMYFRSDWKRLEIRKDWDKVVFKFYRKDGRIVEVKLTYEEFETFLSWIGMENLVEVV